MTAPAWPLENVQLIDVSGSPVDNWTGYVMPAYLAGLPNENAQCCYTLEFECGLRWLLGAGNLGQRVWDALMVHEDWCKARMLSDANERSALSQLRGGQDGNLPAKLSALSYLDISIRAHARGGMTGP
jgi:hypothetical protein